VIFVIAALLDLEIRLAPSSLHLGRLYQKRLEQRCQLGP
jgi:hypothetical protein